MFSNTHARFCLDYMRAVSATPDIKTIRWCGGLVYLIWRVLMMKLKIKAKGKAVLTSLFLFTIAPNAALSGGTFSINKYSINSGGLVSSSNGFSLTGSIAQSDAGVISSSVNFSLSGGFWAGGSSDVIFINGFESI